MTSLAAGDMPFGGSTVPYALPNALLTESLSSAPGNGATNVLADVLSTVAVYPLTLIVTRLQTKRNRKGTLSRQAAKSKDDAYSSEPEGVSGLNGNTNLYGEILQTAWEISETEEGFKGLYTGCLDAAEKAALDSLIRLVAWTMLRRHLRKPGEPTSHGGSPVVRQAVAAVLAEMARISLTAPLETVIARKQVGGSSQKRFECSTEQIVSKVRAEEGLKALWAGYDASLALLLNIPLSLFVHEALKNTVFSRFGAAKKSGARIYVLWAVSYAAASSITYPLSVLRTRAQAPRSLHSHTEDKKSLFRRLREVAQTEGPDALYAGFTANILRALVGHGTAAFLRSFAAAYLAQWGPPLSVVPDRRGEIDGRTISRVNGIIEKRNAGHAGQLPNTVGVEDRGFYSSANPESMSERRRFMNETAELVGDYVEDETEDWRSFYHWFWDPERRRNGDP